MTNLSNFIGIPNLILKQALGMSFKSFSYFLLQILLLSYSMQFPPSRYHVKNKPYKTPQK